MGHVTSAPKSGRFRSASCSPKSANLFLVKVSKGAKIRYRYNQVPNLTQDTNGKVTDSQLVTTNESQEVSLFPAGDLKAHINRLAQVIANTRQKKHKRSTKEVPPWNGQYNILLESLNRFHGANLTINSDVDQDTYTQWPYVSSQTFFFSFAKI